MDSLNQQFQRTLHHLYINPLERCNLRCAICYTKKTSPILSQDQILGFIEKYAKAQSLETVTFCGGEVFLLPYITDVINTLTDRGLFVQVITNGTVDRLEKLTTPNNINIIVSLDGLPDYHDKNRGAGMFQKSAKFLKHAKALGFHTEIFSIVTKQNFPHIAEFEAYTRNIFSGAIPITYHPRKPVSYLSLHPVSNIKGAVVGFDFLEKKEMRELMDTKKTFPPKELGCFQIALTSNGNIYGCCEGTTPIGMIEDNMEVLVSNLKKRLEVWEKLKTNPHCLGCSQPDFVCGLKEYLL